MSESTIDDGLTFDCWCGAKGVTVDYSELESGCGGTGTLHCFCGGDLCVCHFHGEEPCDGCEDCNFGEEDYDEW